MNEAFLEIVELDNGDIVLRPVSDDESQDSEPLATLKISDDTKAFLKDRYFELAKCMFHAGLDFVYADDFESNAQGGEEDDDSSSSKVLH